MKQLFFSMICLCAISVYSQTVKTPFMLDSVNNKGEKFSTDNLLQVPDLNMLRNNARNANFKPIAKGETVTLSVDNALEVNTFVTYLNVEGYEDGKLSVFCNDKIKVALDGKELKKRMSYKDTIKDGDKLEIDLKLEPATYILSFTLLSNSENETHTLKYEIDNENIKTGNETIKGGLTLKEMLQGIYLYDVSICPRGDGNMMVKYSDTDEKGKRTYGYYFANSQMANFIEGSFGNSSVQWVDEDVIFDVDNDLYYIETINGNRRLITDNYEFGKYVIAENIPEGDIILLPNNKPEFILSQTTKIDNSKDDVRQYLQPDDRIGGWRNRTLLSLYNYETGQLQPLTYGYHSTYYNDYSKEKNTILFSVNYDSITQRPFGYNCIYEMNLETMSVDTIVYKEWFASSAQYIPNTDYILLRGSGEAFNGTGNTLKKGVIPNVYHNLLFLMNTKTKQVECITKDFNPSVSSVKITDNQQIFFTAENKDSISLYRYDIATKTITQIDCRADLVTKFDVSKDGKTIAFIAQRYNNYSFAAMIEDTTFTEILQPKTSNNLSLGEMKVWNFNYKGTQIDGRFYVPADFDATKKYPLIVYYYGGTSPTDRMFAMRYSAYLYTAQGYIVYVLNPSGTTGWGQEFAARHVNAWGERTADEIIFGVKQFCKEHSFIDAKKIGCMGASYGGFMTQLLQTKTDIFACAISHAGISDITSYWGEGYWGYSYSSGATANSYPWNRKDIYVERSPLFNADKIKTPILLLHGDSDTNVPVGESIQMFNALKILGKDVEFITIKGEDHGISDYEKRLKWNNTIYAYFAKYLKTNPSWWNALYPEKKL